MVEALEKSESIAEQLVNEALAGLRPRDVNARTPVIEIHIAESLTQAFARQITDLQLDLFERYDLSTRPAYLRTGCIVLGLVVDPVIQSSILRAYDQLQTRAAVAFIAKHRIRKIAMKNLPLPLPTNVDPSGKKIGICSRRLAYV